MMRILIVVPRFVQNFGDFYQFPLGLAYIAAALKAAGHQVFGLNLNHLFGRPEDLVAAEIRSLGIDVCATGGLSPFLQEVKKVFSGARRGNKSVINIAGGGIVSSDPEVCLQIMDIDVGVIGEGEVTICEVAEAYSRGTDLRKVAGIVYRDREGEIVRTPHRDTVMDLARIAWPDYDLLGFGDHLHLQRPLDHHFFQTHETNAPRAIDMITSRSCPYSCTFCFHPVGKVYRERSLDDFFAELETLVGKYRINMVGILDELFSLRKERLFQFCERIKPLNLQWMVQLHVHSADEHVLAAMHDAGCSYISYGIESMNQDVLRSMQKKTRRERIETTLKRTYEHHIGIQGNLIFGDTAETLKTANDTMAWWAHNRKYQVYLSRLQVYPGSPDYIMAIRDDLIKDRVSYAEDLPIFLNISLLNDTDLDALTFQVDIHGRTLLNTAPVRSFKRSWKQLAGRSPAYDIRWTCPRCSHENEYVQCVLRPDHGKSIRVFCRRCRSRWDLRNHASHKPRAVRSLTPQQEQVAVGEAAPRLRAFFTRLAETHFGLRSAAPPRYRYEQQADPVGELRRAGLDLADDPFDAARHVRFAAALDEVGALGAARLHLEQATALKPHEQSIRQRLAALERRTRETGQGETYFVSFSDAAPPDRKSRESGAFNRKTEPDFPVYSRAANRRSVQNTERQRLPIHLQR